MTGRAAKATRRVAVAAAGAVVVAVVWYATMSAGPPGPSTASAQVATGTAEVIRGTATQWVRVGGTLGYQGSYPVVHLGTPGVVTAAAQPGAIVERGGALYAVANGPVRLLYGVVPPYRGFAGGMTDGPDVRQLEENLVALGLDPQHRITVDEHFSTATAAAIRRWQASWGWPVSGRTGGLAEGQVRFLPGPVRVKAVEANPGGVIEPNQPALTATSTSRVVAVQLSTEKQRLVRPGDPVTVSITGLPSFPGRVTEVGSVAAAPPSTGQSANTAAPLAVPVTIAVTVPDAARHLDQVPVQVAISGAVREDVVLVPVIALLAKPGGGYRVRLASGGFVDVEPGLFDEATGRIEVDGALSPGQRVEVPTS